MTKKKPPTKSPGVARNDKSVTKKGLPQRPGWNEQHVENEHRAVIMRRSGASFREIGKTLNVSATTAHRWVRAALAASIQLRDGEADELREMELSRLDGLLVALAPGIRSGDVHAVNAARRISESRRRLLGLDSATAISLTASASVTTPLADLSVAELEARMQRAAEFLTAREMARVPEPVAAPPEPRSMAELYAAELAERALRADGRTDAIRSS